MPGADPYVYVHCENEKSRSQTEKDTLNPEFKAPFIFFRKKPLNYPIVIEVTFHLVQDTIIIQLKHGNSKDIQYKIFDKTSPQVRTNKPNT